VFARDGYHAASVDEIVKTAGVTKGAVYAHFAGKQELFLTLLEERIDRPVRALMSVTETADAATATAATIGEGLSALVGKQREAVLLTFEFWALAVRDPAVGKRYDAWLSSLSAALARALESRHETTGVPLTVPADNLAAGIIAIAQGLAMRQLAGVRSPGAELTTEMLDLLYDGLRHRAGTA
jgi:AcrR family transcriptional regulator